MATYLDQSKPPGLALGLRSWSGIFSCRVFLSETKFPLNAVEGSGMPETCQFHSMRHTIGQTVLLEIQSV